MKVLVDHKLLRRIYDHLHSCHERIGLAADMEELRDILAPGKGLTVGWDGGPNTPQRNWPGDNK